MAMFDRVISLWKSEDLLSQAWEESFQMMVLSNEMFSAAIRYLRRGEEIKTLKKEDSIELLKKLNFPFKTKGDN